MGFHISVGSKFVRRTVWDGPYSSFHDWRKNISQLAGFQPLEQMEGFGGSIPFSTIKSPLKYLLDHSDCDGHITAKRAAKIADALEILLPKMSGYHLIKTKVFIEGCRYAAKKNKPLIFG